MSIALGVPHSRPRGTLQFPIQHVPAAGLCALDSSMSVLNVTVEISYGWVLYLFVRRREKPFILLLFFSPGPYY